MKNNLTELTFKSQNNKGTIHLSIWNIHANFL